jgi:SAM-dependent methyltransferase
MVPEVGARPVPSSGGRSIADECVMDSSYADDPAGINGDLPLSRAQLDAYMRFHAERNRANAHRSRREKVLTAPIPVSLAGAIAASSPARVMVSAFFTMAARRLAPFFRGRDITMLDLGCGGGGAVMPFFEEAGLRGRYIGLDIAAPKAFSAAPTSAFTRELIVADVHTFNPASLPSIDLLVSATALEHIRDDAGVINRFAARLAPGGAQAHYVPGEAALLLYGQHGWRQYSPACLRRLFPTAELYRAGGPCSAALHKRAITRGSPNNAWRDRHPCLYPILRDFSLCADRLLGNVPATMYGVIVPPAPAVNAAMNSAA